MGTPFFSLSFWQFFSIIEVLLSLDYLVVSLIFKPFIESGFVDQQPLAAVSNCSSSVRFVLLFIIVISFEFWIFGWQLKIRRSRVFSYVTKPVVQHKKSFLSDFSAGSSSLFSHLPKTKSHRQDRISLWLSVLSAASHVCFSQVWINWPKCYQSKWPDKELRSLFHLNLTVVSPLFSFELFKRRAATVSPNRAELLPPLPVPQEKHKTHSCCKCILWFFHRPTQSRPAEQGR